MIDSWFELAPFAYSSASISFKETLMFVIKYYRFQGL